LHTGHLSLTRIVELLATNPARILGLPGGGLAPGAPADVTVLAPDAAVEVRAAAFRSRARNTPFDGWKLKGAVAAVLVGGRTAYVNDEVAAATAFEIP
ncbi:MAG: amidohydrolase family protein, partial [Acidobacteria bacterium]|nr:amidohydrolase family protein [Acidobacteriota bacterium]